MELAQVAVVIYIVFRVVAVLGTWWAAGKGITMKVSMANALSSTLLSVMVIWLLIKAYL